MISVLYQIMRMALDDLHTSCMAGFRATSKSNLERKCFPILASHLSNIPEEMLARGTQHRLPVRKPCDRCSRKTENI